MKKIEFVIRTLNEEKLLQQVIDSIRMQKTELQIAITIVDSGSNDDTLLIAKDNNCKILNIKPEEWSWGKSLNIGINDTDADIIGIISGHCILNGMDFLEKVIEIMEVNVDAIYGRQIPLKGYDSFEEVELIKWYPKNKNINLSKNKLIGVSNACCFMKRTAWEILKFDEHAQSMEDGIWAYGAIDKNMNLIYTSEITIYHSHKYDEKYIYRKWYSRTLEGLKFSKSIYGGNKVYKIKEIIKKFIYKYYLTIYNYIELIEYYVLYNKNQKLSDIYKFYHAKGKAINNAHYDYFNKNGKDYWKVI